MRILYLTPMPPRSEAPGAMPLVFNAALSGLKERHEVTLVTVVGDEPGEVDAAVELQRSGLDVHVVDRRRPSGLKRWRRRARLVGTWTRGAYPWRTVWFADPAVQGTLDRLTLARDFDIAAVEDNSMAIFRLPRSLPSVLTEHEVRQRRPIDWHGGPPSNWPGWAFRELDWRRWPRYHATVWRQFDLVQVFTRLDRERVAALAPELLDRVRVNPFGVELPAVAGPAQETPGAILFVGNFTHPPNVDAALWLLREIMPRLRSLNVGARLSVVGGALPDEIRRLTARDVDVVGAVPTIAPYLESAAVVLAPVRTGGGMRMKVLQALAARKPVVTTSRGIAGLMPGDEDLPLVVADDAGAFAAAIADLLRDRDLRLSLAARAGRFALDRHSPAAYATRLEAVYREAVMTRRRVSSISTTAS